jgi:plastocyanin
MEQPEASIRRGWLVVLGLAGQILSACGGGLGEEGAPPATAKVAIRSFGFTPQRITVMAGTEVTWINGDGILHTVTTGTPGEQGVPGVSEDTAPTPDGLLDRKLDGKGTAVSFRFTERGRYAYYCAIHAGMTGTVVVR